MEDKNCDLLFEYLRSILYDTKVSSLALSNLDEPYQKLGRGLQYLDKAIMEMKAYSAALSLGNLSEFTPSRHNPLCENLKNIHANLNHLTWQAKQVAKGDYSQTVSYLGEFSEAFNTMTRQLSEREESLRQEAFIEKRNAAMLESYNQLLVTLISRSEEKILVTDAANGAVLYCSQNDSGYFQTDELLTLCLNHVKEMQNSQASGSADSETDKCTWETSNSAHRIYRITTGRMKWQGKKAYTHIIREITEEKEREEQLEIKAHQDMLTGIGNRHFFHEKVSQLLTGTKPLREPLVFCYCDLDHLKYVNDHYGHQEGDWYIRCFVETILSQIRHEDIFARIGGDEFCFVLKGCPKERAEEKVRAIQNAFSANTARPYPKSFSCGIIPVFPKQNADLSIEEILQQADAIMYQQKRQHKEVYIKELAALPQKPASSDDLSHS